MKSRDQAACNRAGCPIWRRCRRCGTAAPLLQRQSPGAAKTAVFIGWMAQPGSRPASKTSLWTARQLRWQLTWGARLLLALHCNGNSGNVAC